MVVSDDRVHPFLQQGQHVFLERLVAVYDDVGALLGVDCIRDRIHTAQVDTALDERDVALAETRVSGLVHYGVLEFALGDSGVVVHEGGVCFICQFGVLDGVVVRREVVEHVSEF